MSKLVMGVLAGTLMAGVTYAAAATLVAVYHTVAASHYSPLDYANAVRLAASEYQSARIRCEAIPRGQRQFCVAQAHAVERRANAGSESQFLGTSKSRLDAGVAAAEARYRLAQEACNDQSGCGQEPKAKRARGGTRALGQTQITVSDNERNAHGI